MFAAPSVSRDHGDLAVDDIVKIVVRSNPSKALALLIGWHHTGRLCLPDCLFVFLAVSSSVPRPACKSCKMDEKLAKLAQVNKVIEELGGIDSPKIPPALAAKRAALERNIAALAAEIDDDIESSQEVNEDGEDGSCESPAPPDEAPTEPTRTKPLASGRRAGRPTSERGRGRSSKRGTSRSRPPVADAASSYSTRRSPAHHPAEYYSGHPAAHPSVPYGYGYSRFDPYGRPHGQFGYPPAHPADPYGHPSSSTGPYPPPYANGSRSYPPADTVDPRDREIEELRRELARAKLAPGSAAPAPVDPRDRELEELRQQLAAVKAGSSTSSAIAVDAIAVDPVLARELEELKHKVAAKAASSTPSHDSTTASRSKTSVRASTHGTSTRGDPMMTSFSKMAEERAKAEKALSDFENSSYMPTTVNRKQAEAEKRLEDLRLKSVALKSGAPSASDMRTAQKEMEKFKGVDVAFLMDCTGSMQPYINGTRDKIVEIMRLMPTINPEAKVRLGFVGYRDHCDSERFIKIDFTSAQNVERLASDLGKIRADGGGDAPEDIAGGLHMVAHELTWLASTRLVIHFADAPCHGSQYHSFSDSYPGGDPDGKVPEELLKFMCKRRVDYTFVQINPSATASMLQKFQAAYDGTVIPQIKKGTFTVMDLKARSDEFLPKAIANTIMESIRSSMSRSVHLSASTRRSTFTMS